MVSITRHVLSSNALPYFVRRNTRGSLPVYSDIRNAGTRYQVHIRNVEGRVDSLAQELKQSLNARHLSVRVQHQRHIILSGGRFKKDVMGWLAAKGF